MALLQHSASLFLRSGITLSSVASHGLTKRSRLRTSICQRILENRSNPGFRGRIFGNLSVVNFSTAGPNNEKKNKDENENSQKSAVNNRLIGAGGALALLWGKGKWVLGAVKLTKFSSVISMAATTAAYSFFFGLPFAVGMVGQIALHESGHALAMARLGIPFSPAVFVPFMGASIAMKEKPKNVSDEIYIAIAGPVFGGGTALALAAVGTSLDSQLLIALADFGLMINLFNLLPIGSLDGGYIAGGLNRWTLVGGLGLGGAMIYQGMISNPIFYLVMLAGTFSTYQRFFGPQDEYNRSYYRMGNGERAFWTFSYFGLIALLAVAMQINNRNKKSIKQLREESRAEENSKDSWSYKVEKFADSWAEDDPYLVGDSPKSLEQREQEFINSYFRDDGPDEL